MQKKSKHIADALHATQPVEAGGGAKRETAKGKEQAADGGTRPEPSETADSVQAPREVPRPILRSRSQRELEEQGSQHSLEMQELPADRDRPHIAGQDSNSRLRKLHAELQCVVERHDQEKASVQRWGAWLVQFCTLGNLLQAACSGVMILSLLISAEDYKSHLMVALILCSSLVLLLWMQHATFQRRGMMMGSRVRRFLSRLEWYIKNPLEASNFGAPVAGGANVWVQTTRPISAVQVISDSGSVSLPTQLLVSGDRVTGPTDHWLVNGYCEQSEMNNVTVKDTPSAAQLSKVLSQPRRPQTQLEDQMKVVKSTITWTVTFALIISIFSSAVLLGLYPEQSTLGDLLNLLIVRHVPVCMPLLPISVFLSSVVLQVACNSYLAAKIQYKYNLRAGAGGDRDNEDGDDEHSLQGRSRFGVLMKFLSSLRARATGRILREGSEADNAPMMNTDGDAERQARKSTGALKWSSVLAHMLQRFKIPKADQDRALAANIMNPCADLVDALGSATVLCFPDVDGIVCEPLLSPKQILLLSPDPKSADSSTATVKVIELLGAEKGAPVGACTFQDAGAIEQYLSQLKPLGLNCLLNTNAHSDTYTTFIECTLRDLVHQRQVESTPVVLGSLSSLGGLPGGSRGGGAGLSGGGSSSGGGWVRSDAYIDMVSCDSCDASYLLAPVIGFASGVASTFNRLLELQILVRPSAAKLHEQQMQHHQQRRGSSACGTPGGTGGFSVGIGGGSPAATSFMMNQRTLVSAGDDVAAAAAFGVPPPLEAKGLLPRVSGSFTGSEAGGATISGNIKYEQSPHMMGVVVEDSQQQLQLFAKGDVDSVLGRCSIIWDGQELRALELEDVKLILRHCSECYQKHYRCVAFSYVSLAADKRDLIKSCSQLGRSVFLDQDEMGGLSMLGASDWELPHGVDGAVGTSAFSLRRPKAQPAAILTSIQEDLMQDHIFIGMLTMRHRPYSEITESMDILSEAGIRFVFFSEMQEAATVACGNQLGLWSDWNCCISLRDLPLPARSIPPSPPGSGISGRSHGNRTAAYSHNISSSGPRLPHGIRSIRRHLIEADDVPLRVSMFCDSSPETITSMVGILQENGECVVSCGSSRNVHNMQLFATADLSMSISPQPPSRQFSLMYGDGARRSGGVFHVHVCVSAECYIHTPHMHIYVWGGYD